MRLIKATTVMAFLTALFACPAEEQIQTDAGISPPVEMIDDDEDDVPDTNERDPRLDPRGEDFECDDYSIPEATPDILSEDEFSISRSNSCPETNGFATLFKGRLIDSGGVGVEGSAAICSDVSPDNTLCLRPVFSQKDGHFQIAISPDEARCAMGFKFRAYGFQYGHAVYYDYLTNDDIVDGIVDLGDITLTSLTAATEQTPPPFHTTDEPIVPSLDVEVTLADGSELSFDYADMLPLILPSQSCWSYSALSSTAMSFDELPSGLKETAPVEFDRVWAFGPEVDFLRGAQLKLQNFENANNGTPYNVYVVGGLAVTPIPGSGKEFEEGKWTLIETAAVVEPGYINVDELPALTWIGVKRL